MMFLKFGTMCIVFLDPFHTMLVEISFRDSIYHNLAVKLVFLDIYVILSRRRDTITQT